MKKLLAILISVVMILTIFVSCSPDDSGSMLPDTENGAGDNGSNDQTGGETPDDGNDSGECEHSTTKTTGVVAPTCTANGYSGDKTCNECGKVVESGSAISALGHDFVNGVCSTCGAADPGHGDINSGTHDYNVFTSSEKKLFNEYFGFVIPFIANDEYYVEEYEYEDEIGINFYTYGNTEAEFEAYLALFGQYTSEGEETDDYGDTWYFFSSDDTYIDVSYYYYEEDWLVDVYVYILDDSDSGDSGDDDGEILDRIYVGFTADEKELFNDYFGFVVPFIPNDYYCLEELEDYGIVGLNFYAYDNTKAEFNAYLELFASYTNEGTEDDEYGDTWYLFSKDDVCIDIAYYYYDDAYIVDVYVYYVDENGGSGDSGSGGSSGSTDHTYTGFTSSEKALFNQYFGFVIPFITNDYYYVEDLAAYDIEGINFYTFDNTQAEFNAYLKLFASYTNEGTEVDEYGDTWYLFSKGDVCIDVAYYEYEGSYVVDVYVYYAEGTTGGSGDSGSGDNGSDTELVYTDFTSDEKALFNQYFGFVIPFISNGEYYVDELADYGIDGLGFYTVGNTKAEFDAYLQLFASYTNEGTEVDEDGDTWYLFSNGDVCIDIAYYKYEGYDIVDVYVYYADEDSDSDDNGGSGDIGSGDDNESIGDSTVDAWLENYECITVSEALALCEKFVSNPSSTRYYMVVTIDSIEDAKFGKLYVSDSTGTIMVYGTRSSDGKDLFGDLANKPSVGDTILIYGTLQNYKGNTKEVQNAWLIDFVGNDSGSGDNGGNNSGSTNHTYSGFTTAEKNLFNEYFGFVIPFIPNDEYCVEEYEYEDEIGLNFYAFDNTKAEFEAYLKLFASYTNDGTDVDDCGDTWYFFSKGEVYIDVAYYEYDGSYVVDVYVYYTDDNGNSGDNGDSGNNGGDTGSTDHTYNGFTSSEKELFNDYFGFVIPFIPNDEYYVEEYEYDDEIGLNFYAFDNTKAEFEAYIKLFASYTNDGTDVDEDGDTWYFFSKDDFYVDICYYLYDGSYVVDVYVYYADENGGNNGGNNGNNGGNNGGSSSNDGVITNDGAGLPTDEDGVYDVDFTDAEYVKDVTDQGYYIDGCPTTGSPAVLVIPIQFSDIKASGKGYTIDAIKNAFLKDGETDYYSVYDYYYISSYGQLTLDITVVEWFTPKNNSSHYASYYEDGYFMGDQLIMDEALAYLAGIMDLSDFDSDGNGIIDSVVLINTLDVGDDDFHWAYRYWNYYVDNDGYYYEYDGVSANDYLWASYQFLYETSSGYDNVGGMDTYTFIHEFGHILGVDDYYDTSYNGEPLGGYDIMDSMKGDHNAFSKFNLGWLTTSRLVVTDGSVTLTLEDFSKNGDTIIIANNWDPKLGAYQEYYVLVYYTNLGLNGGDNGYFTRDGIVVYHVNASLYSEIYEGELSYDIYNNNTDASDQYGTEDNLIELVKSASGTYTYVEGDKIPTVTLDGGETLKYTFTVVSLVDGVATITFEKI